MSSYFVGRQPILDTHGNTFAYELLFRTSGNNSYSAGVDGDAATATVIVNSILEAGFNTLVGKNFAFINCTNYFLENPQLLEVLPPERCVLEVLENVIVNDKVIEGIRTLKSRGFTIALDDYTNEPQFEPVKPYADIIKYDLTDYSMPALAEFRNTDKAAGRFSLVERVETNEEFEALKAVGFDYFQGYYFAKPRVISGARLPPNKLTVLQLLSEINKPDSTIDDLAKILSRDASLGIRTLKFVNSPITGLRTRVTSVKHAAALLGRATIRNWISLMIMTDLDEKPAEVMKMALTRARFCQLMAKEERLADEGMYFTIGLLSLIDVLTDSPLEDALSEISLDEEMLTQLRDRSGIGGYMLNTVEVLERPDRCSGDTDNSHYALEHYRSALQWTEQVHLV